MLILGVLEGVVLAIGLSLFWMLSITLRPSDAVLGRLPGSLGFHSLADFPDAETVPRLLIYRFDANLVFFHINYVRQRLRHAARRSSTPVRWVMVDLRPVSIVDATALPRFDELREDLGRNGVTPAVVRARQHLGRFFERDFVERRMLDRTRNFPSIRAAVEAYQAQTAGDAASS